MKTPEIKNLWVMRTFSECYIHWPVECWVNYEATIIIVQILAASLLGIVTLQGIAPKARWPT